MNQVDIFYADDDEDDLLFFKEAAEKISSDSHSEITLHLHKNGEHLIESIKKNKPYNGVVFLDINMPLKSGFQLLEEIRKEPEIQTFPVIMYSTSSNQDNVEKSRELGANFYVIKPYEFGHLVKLLSNFIEVNWKTHRVDINNFLYK